MAQNQVTGERERLKTQSQKKREVAQNPITEEKRAAQNTVTGEKRGGSKPSHRRKKKQKDSIKPIFQKKEISYTEVS